jgi:hypothetical protein
MHRINEKVSRSKQKIQSETAERTNKLGKKNKIALTASLKEKQERKKKRQLQQRQLAPIQHSGRRTRTRGPSQNDPNQTKTAGARAHGYGGRWRLNFKLDKHLCCEPYYACLA